MPNSAASEPLVDLRLGVPLAQLLPNRPLLGHVDHQPVLLVRIGEHCYAVGARCPHAGAWLHEAASIVDTSVVCPWHHARFDVRTGQMEQPPALKSLPAYQVRVHQQRVMVGDQLPATPRLPSSEQWPESVTMVGAGAAAVAATTYLRQVGYTRPITIYGDEYCLPYDRTQLSKGLLKNKLPIEQLPLWPVPSLQLAAMVHVGQSVVAIDARQRTIALQDGQIVEFDALLIATGARARQSALPGAQLPHVSKLRTLGDALWLLKCLSACKHVTIVGGGFVAMEAASSLLSLGVAVTVVVRGALPLAVLGEAVGAWSLASLRQAGAEVLIQTEVVAIHETCVLLDNGRSVATDRVLIAIGSSCEVDLAQTAKLQVEDHGIVVDTEQRTSNAAIWAAGDVAVVCHPHFGRLQVGHWAYAQAQGCNAARSLLGLCCHPLVPFFWSDLPGGKLRYVGHHRPDSGHVQVFGDLVANHAAVAFGEHPDRITAVATIGADTINIQVEQLLEQGELTAITKLLGAHFA